VGADDGLPKIFFPSSAEWEEWLEDNHAGSDRLQDAKKPETRARRLGKFVAMLEAGETIYP
jgi:uncharacterized protein YdeI (YjbR/CyaY-like superfamily)